MAHRQVYVASRGLPSPMALAAVGPQLPAHLQPGPITDRPMSIVLLPPQFVPPLSLTATVRTGRLCPSLVPSAIPREEPGQDPRSHTGDRHPCQFVAYFCEGLLPN